MKKITLMIAFVAMATMMNAQMKVGARAGYGFMGAGSGEGVGLAGFYYFGGTFDKALSEKASFGLGLDYMGGGSASSSTTSVSATASSTWIGIEPSIKFYPKEVYRGFYIGSDIAFNLGMGDGTQTFLNIGPKLGWDFVISDNIRLGLATSIGYAKTFEKTSTYTSINPSTGAVTTAETTIAGGGGIFSRFGLTFGYILGK
jgi:hypothetical protein